MGEERKGEELEGGVSPPRGGFNYFMESVLGDRPQTPFSPFCVGFDFGFFHEKRSSVCGGSFGFCLFGFRRSFWMVGDRYDLA